MPKKTTKAESPRPSNASVKTRLQRFKNDQESQEWLREVLNHPVMREAIDLLKADFEGRDVPTDAPEVASVRALSMRAGFDSFPIKLRFLTEAPIPDQEPLTEDWGTQK